MALKLLPISTAFIIRFQHHKALGEHMDCNFQFYSFFMTRVYLSNHKAKSSLLTSSQSKQSTFFFFLTIIII